MRGRRQGLGLALLAAAAVLAGGAALLWWVHTSIGPDTRRVNVRWRTQVASTQRVDAERALGLEHGVEVGGQTWSYTVRDRSRPAIAAILNSPLVADTHHLDGIRQRITLDAPDPANIHHPSERVLLRLPWLLAPLEADALPAAAAVLAVAALALVALARRSLVWLIRSMFATATLIPAAMSAIRHGAVSLRDAMDRRLGHDPARRGPSPAEYLCGVGLSLVFLAPLLQHGPYEEEVVQHSIFPNQMFYRALFRGEWLYWLNNLGFGTPLPGDPLLFHPVAAPLLAFSSARVAMSALWIVHAAVSAVFFLRLAALSQVRSSFLRLCLLALYLWSVVAIAYYYDTDWITNVVAWSLYPVLVFALYSTVRSPSPARLETTVGLAALFAFWILNAHPGYVAPLVAVLVVYTVAAAPPRAAVYRGLIVAGVLCTAATSAHLYALAHEALLFAPSTLFERTGATLAHYPLAAVAFGRTDRRGAFIGLAVLAAAIVAVLSPAARRDAHLRGCAAAFMAAVGLSVLPGPAGRWLAPSGSAFFRDPYIFFGLLLAGATLQRCLDRRLTWLVAVLLAAQVVQQGRTATVPGLRDFLDHRNVLLFYRYQGHAVGIGRDLVAASRRFGRRVYLSPQIDAAMRGTLSPSGVHFSSDLVLIGLNPVNGWFKNVAMGAIAPSESMMESHIVGDRRVIENGALLDVLGIDLVLTGSREGLPPGGLIEVARRPVKKSRQVLEGDLVIAANPDAWPKAVLLDAGAAAVPLPVQEGCAHRAALCRDYESLVSRRLPGTVALTERDGAFAATFPPAAEPRLLFISSLYRPEWEATAAGGARLDVTPVADAFLGVAVPPGVGGVTLAYRPRVLQALTWVSSLTFAGLCAVSAIAISRRRASRDPLRGGG